MKTLLFILAAASAPLVCAQTDALPKLDSTFLPDELPSLDAPGRLHRGSVDVSFTGNAAYDGNRLRREIARQIQTINEYGLDEASAYDTAHFLEVFYRSHGYASVSVRPLVTGSWRLRLAVSEGPLATLESVTFHGNSAFDDGTLRRYLLGPIRERFPRIRGIVNLPFVAADIERGTDLVRRFYAAEGYLNARISPAEILNDRAKASISLRIEEGRQYRFGEIRFTGDASFPRDALMEKAGEDVRGPFTEGRVDAVRRRIQDFYRTRGYYLARVEADVSPESAINGTVPASFHITPGQLFRFDGITVSGNRDVRTSFIRKRLERLNGQPYSPSILNRQFRELIETGLFRDLRLTPEVADDGLLRVDVAVEEAEPKEFGIGIGYATYDGGIVSLSYGDRNLFGSGRPLRLEAEINQRGYNGEIVYADPWFFDSDYELRLQLFAISRNYEGYTANDLGFRPSLSRPIGDHYEIGAFALLKGSTITDILIEPEDLVGPTEYSVASFGFTQTFDYRNNTALPTDGFIFTTSLDAAPDGLGDVAFVRGVVRASHYVPVTKRSTFALGARGGIISPLNANTLPINERFLNGGATTVRSFSEYSLGPKDDDDHPVGGQAFTVFNAEYSFPLVGDLQGAVFFDAGNLLPEARDFGLEDMGYGVGAGLRYNLPIGALRLDFGLNPAPQSGEAIGAMHFAIGVAF